MLDSLVVERVDPERVRLRPVDARADGEHAARFQTVLTGELDRAYRLATVILGDESEGEDAVHDAAEIAWRRRSELRDQERAAAWFRRILINVCRDRLRRRRRWRLLEVLRSPFTHEHPTVSDTSAALAARDQLQRAFERLSPDERLAVVLRYEEDLTVPATAELLGIAQGTAKSRLHYALAKLRAALQEGHE
jgi:RNA polymerase sigma factor (sigma-70 family)